LIAGQRLGTIGRFVIVGILATATYYGSAVALGIALSPMTANVVAWAISVVVSYLGQNYFTFRAGGRHEVFAPRFALTTAILFLLSCAVTYFGSSVLKLAQPVVAAMVAVSYPAASFVLHMSWTFSKAVVAADAQPPPEKAKTRVE
jgi:putative flippase GtrA